MRLLEAKQKHLSGLNPNPDKPRGKITNNKYGSDWSLVSSEGVMEISLQIILFLLF